MTVAGWILLIAGIVVGIIGLALKLSTTTGVVLFILGLIGVILGIIFLASGKKT